MAINNPYIPGDPYSYDLKWIVAKIKEILLQLGTLDEAIEKKIFEGFVEHSIVQFHTVPEMLAADLKDNSIVLTLGYNEAGDLGGMFYLIKDFNPGQCSLDYFLTMDNNAQIAIPVLVTPYVTPEMFGSDGSAAKTAEALGVILSYYSDYPVIFSKEYRIEDTITGEDAHLIGIDGAKITHPMIDVFEFNGSVTVEGLAFEGDPVVSTVDNGLHIIAVKNGHDSVIKDCSFKNVDAESAIYFQFSPRCTAQNNVIDTYMFIGILVENSSDHAVITQNKIYNCTNQTQGYGIQSNSLATGTYSNGVVISENIIEGIGAWDAIMVHGGQDIVISGNVCRGCRTGIDASAIYKNATSVQKNLTISGNVLTSTTNASYSSAAPNAGIIAGFDNGSMSENISIVNNTIKGFGPLTTGSNDAGILVQNCEGFSVSGNSITDCKRAIKFRSNDEHLAAGTVTGNSIVNYTGNGMYFLQGVFVDIALIGNMIYRSAPASLPTWLGFDSNSRFIKVFEKDNKCFGALRYITSSSIRTAFHMEYAQAISAGQTYCAYEKGDTIKVETPSTYDKWICTTGGIPASTSWAPNTAFNRYTWLTDGTNAFLVVKGGTSGSSAPAALEGFQTNGTMEVIYCGSDTPVWKNCGAIV